MEDIQKIRTLAAGVSDDLDSMSSSERNKVSKLLLERLFRDARKVYDAVCDFERVVEDLTIALNDIARLKTELQIETEKNAKYEASYRADLFAPYYDRMNTFHRKEADNMRANSSFDTFIGHMVAKRKIEAIKLFRNSNGYGLKEAKDFVENLEERTQEDIVDAGFRRTANVEVLRKGEDPVKY